MNQNGGMPEVLEEAIEFAMKAHRRQVRDGESPLPYITHPLDVLANLRYTGNVTDPDLLVTAVLHDVVEESAIDPGEIEKLFGSRVRQLVEELTRREPTLKEKEGLNPDQVWELRSGMLLAEIAQMSPDAQAVKLADRLSNLNEARRVKLGKKLERYRRQTAQILKIIPKSANPGLWSALKALQQEID
jgi:(p)ppGpp synthase/HD superfamily hydrolase